MNGFLRKKIRLIPAALVFLVVGCSQAPDTPLEEVQPFGSNPGELRMLKYVPASLKAGLQGESRSRAAADAELPGGERSPAQGSPLVVALHGCMQDAPEYGRDSGWIRLADRWGFLLLFPEQRRGNNLTRCFSWYSPQDHRRDAGEALSIRQMVDRMGRDHAVDPQRIYVTGISAGAAMTLALAADYPEVFAGAAPLAGIAYGCADGLVSGLTCMRAPPNNGAVDWGNAVRSATSHTGPWPRVSLWQGDADSIVDPANARAIVLQWTNVHGIDIAPEQVKDAMGDLHSLYRNRDGEVLVESHRIEGMGHGVPVDPGPGEDQCGKEGRFFPDMNICSSQQIARFWGLHGEHSEE
jgi:poly(hydroxyalkanoate) depolymerase family esterase